MNARILSLLTGFQGRQNLTEGLTVRLLQMTGEEYQESLSILKANAEDTAAAFAVPGSEAASWARNGPPQQIAMFMRLALALGVTFDEAVEIAAEGP